MSRDRGALRLEPTCLAHLADLHGLYREEDEREAFAASMLSAEDAVIAAIQRSTVTAAVLDPAGKAIAVFGVAVPSALGGVGMPWMMGSRAIDRYPREAANIGREIVAALREHFALLVNHVDVRNVKAVRWLRAVGFAVGEPEPYGPFSLPFHPFELRR